MCFNGKNCDKIIECEKNLQKMIILTGDVYLREMFDHMEFSAPAPVLYTKSAKRPIIIKVCIHQSTVWKLDSHAKYRILLKYRNHYEGYPTCSFQCIS